MEPKMMDIKEYKTSITSTVAFMEYLSLATLQC
jgi:hypothetical protein